MIAKDGAIATLEPVIARKPSSQSRYFSPYHERIERIDRKGTARTNMLSLAELLVFSQWDYCASNAHGVVPMAKQ